MNKMKNNIAARLNYKPFSHDMLNHLTALHSDVDVMQHMRGGIETRDQSLVTLAEYIDCWQHHGVGMWALFDQQSGDFVGECGFRYHDVVGGMALRFGLKKTYWGQGLAQEAVGQAIDFAFTKTVMVHVHSIALDVNTRSCQVMELFGFHIASIGVRDTPGLRLYRLAKADYLKSR